MAATLLVLIAGAAALPLFFDSGFLNTRSGGDSPFLLFRLHQLHSVLADGHFPARWMPDAAYGLGYPFFNYYAALPFYFASALSIGDSQPFIAALKLTQLTGFVLAAIGVYLWLRPYLQSPWARLAAAAAYTFAPFHMVNVYVRGDSLGEFWAMAFFPLCFYTADRLAQKRTATALALLSLAYAALIFSHNISALIFSPLLGLYMLLAVLHNSEDWSERLRLTTLFSIAIFLGMALVAFFWLPAILEKDFGQLGTVTEGYFHFSRHFRTLDLVQPQLWFDYSVTVDESHTPFAMGLLQALLGVAGTVALGIYFKRTRHWHAAMVLIGVLVSTLMITPLSTLVWEYVPLLDFTQFPWRFLSVQALFVAAAIGYFAQALPKPAVSGIGISLVLAAAALVGLQLDFIPLTSADVTAERLQEYEYFTGNIGTTIRFEYLPNTVTNRPYVSSEYVTGTPEALLINGAAVTAQVQKLASEQHWQIDATEPSQIAIPLHYWPGWQATLNNAPVNIQPLPDLGWTTVEVPAGTHALHLFLADTPIRKTANQVSIAAVAIAFSLCFWTERKKGNLLGLLGAGIVVFLTISLLAGIADGMPQSQLSGPSTMDFGLRGYRHQENVTFDDGSQLASIDTNKRLTRPGYLFDVPNPIEGVAQRPGIFLPRVERDATPLTPAGVTRGALYLAPVRMQPAAEAYTGSAPLGVDLISLETTQLDTDLLGVQLGWGVDRALAQRLQLGLKLTNQAGETLSAIDVQAGTGAWSSELWQAGVLTADNYALDLPTDLPAGNYALTVTLYHAVTLQPYVNTIYTVSLGDVAAASQTDTPFPTDITFGALSLLALEHQLENDHVTVVTNWGVQAPLHTSYKYFIHVLDPATGEIIAQADVYPGNGTNATNIWQTGQTQTDQVSIPLPPGTTQYQVAIGWYHPVLGSRLPVFSDGNPVPDNRYIAPN